MQELDLSQQLYYSLLRMWIWGIDELYNRYKNIDLSPEEIRERGEAEMVVIYKSETDGVSKVRLALWGEV